MKINKILKEFVKECAEKLNLMSIIQFGSSTYLKEAKDIDLIFFSNDEIFPTKDYVKLFDIISKFERKYKNVFFDIAGGFHLRKAKYKIAVIPQQKLDLKLKIDPFFISAVYKDKNKKILFGKDPFTEPIGLTNNEIISKIILEVNFALRRCLDKETKPEAINFLFKTVFRLMLSNENVSRKDDLLKKFKLIYSKISLPKNSEKILYGKIRNKDFEEVLEFVNQCISFLKG